MNKLKGSKVYLVGPMDFAKDRGFGWRSTITPFLRELEIGVLDPTNKCSLLGHEDIDHIDERRKIISQLDDKTNLRKNELFDEYHEIMKEVVAIDLRMVDTADFIIAYVNTDIHMCGSYHEIAMAVGQRKPVIVMCEQRKHKAPPWLFGILKHEMIFSTWEEVKGYIQSICFDEEIDTLNRWRFFDYGKLFQMGTN